MLQFDRKFLEKYSDEQISKIKSRLKISALFGFFAQFYYSYVFPYSWEVGDYIISSSIGYIFFILWFVVSLTLYWSCDLINPMPLDDHFRSKDAPTKMMKFMDHGVKILFILMVVALVLLGYTMSQSKTLNQKNEPLRIVSELASLKLKQCVLKDHQVKYNSLLNPIVVSTLIRNDTTSVEYYTDQVSKGQVHSRNRYRVPYACANNTTEYSIYRFRELIAH